MPPGLPGPPGVQGPPFANAVVEAVTTVPAGGAATVSVFFDGSDVRFTFGIPEGAPGTQGSEGPQGPAPSSAVVDSVTTLNPGENATASVWLDGGGIRFSFGIPRGATGDTGPQGVPGPVFANAVIDGVTTLNPWENATASVQFDGTYVHFTFGIPRGAQGEQGAPGEVTASGLASAIAGTSNNTNGVPTLDTPFANDPPTLADLETMRAKVNELIAALRR